MKRRFAHIVILVAFLLATLAGIAIAQDEEITLDSLADLVTALTTRVDAIEAILTGPGAIELEDGSCQIAADGGLQNEAFLTYKDTWSEWPSMEQMRVSSIAVLESGSLGITYEYSFTNRQVMETWDGCEFLSASKWWEVDWEGNKTFPLEQE